MNVISTNKLADWEAVAKVIDFPDWVVFGVSKFVYSTLQPALDAFDVHIHRIFSSQLKYFETGLEPRRHVFASKLPLMRDSDAIFTVLAYFAVLIALYPISKLLGRMELKAFSLLHNLFLFLLSMYMCVGIFVTTSACGYPLWNTALQSDQKAWRLGKFMWLFYASKIPEFLDTCIMMLKQNYRQVSFLHVFHHSSVFVFWFFVVSMSPGGDSYFSAMLNCGVHVLMYGYYFWTGVFSHGPVRKLLNHIKFFITYLQMTQFCFIAGQCIYDLWIVPPEKLLTPRILVQMLLSYMLILLCLFSNFLIQNKGKEPKEDRLVSPKGSPKETRTSSPKTSAAASVTAKKKQQEWTVWDDDFGRLR